MMETNLTRALEIRNQEAGEAHARERKAFDTLSVYGVPQERARSVANGIEVLVTRMQREIDALRAQLAVPLPEEVEAMVRRLNNHALPDPHDEREVLHAPLLREAAILLRSLARQVAERDAEIAAHKDTGKALYAATDKLIEERDALRKALTDPVGRVGAANESRPYVHFVRLREPRQDEVGKLLFAIAAQSPPPSAAAAVEDAQRGL